jgi:hypothetical protein
MKAAVSSMMLATSLHTAALSTISSSSIVARMSVVSGASLAQLPQFGRG